MSDEIRCSFCETLATTRPGSWGGRASKCPLCRQELWTASDGTTYRLTDAPVAARGKRSWVIGAGALLALGLGIGGYFAFKPREADAPVGNAPVSKQIVAAAKVDGPDVQAKWAWPAYDAQAKPLPARVAKETVKPTVVAQTPARSADKPTPVSKGAGRYSASWPGGSLSTVQTLEEELLTVSEVDLDSDYLKWSRKDLAAKVKEIITANKKEKDAFVRQLMKDRQDVSGLPFLLGKDCAIDQTDAKTLRTHSLLIREMLGELVRPSRYKGMQPGDHVTQFWSLIDNAILKREGFKTATIAAYRQILLGENAEFRFSLVQRLKSLTDAKATDVIVNRALFDLDPSVRHAAVEALRAIPKEQYVPAVKEALRYPWPPVVRHAAQVSVTLDLQELVPHFVSLLTEKDPAAPYTVKGDDGKVKVMAREMVRINHHRNCMLCHPPFDASDKDAAKIARDLPAGPITSAQDSLPPSSSPIYYEARSGLVVRADITYLRQDFSVMQPVKNYGKWPVVQRFDFLVRTRELTAREAAMDPPSSGEYHLTIAEALSGLTGRQAEPTAQAWRAALAQPQSPPGARAKPAR